MKYLMLLVSFGVLFISCNHLEKQEYKEITAFKAISEQSKDGKKLMEQKCYVCHSPNATMQDRLAPPMIAVKRHYVDDDSTKEQFAEAIWKWVEKPAIENSKMKGAVRRFGVMPYQPFEKSEIESIANYMFDNDIEQPEWFDEHFRGVNGKKRKN
jgi:mono/diheme cytochrome c family protein